MEVLKALCLSREWEGHGFAEYSLPFKALCCGKPQPGGCIRGTSHTIEAHVYMMGWRGGSFVSTKSLQLLLPLHAIYVTYA